MKTKTEPHNVAILHSVEGLCSGELYMWWFNIVFVGAYEKDYLLHEMPESFVSTDPASSSFSLGRQAMG